MAENIKAKADMDILYIRKCKQNCAIEECKDRIKCVDICSFEKMYSWEYYSGFAYDYITAEEIKSCKKYITCCDIEKEWEDDNILRNNKTIPDELKHAIRVARLVDEYKKGRGISAVSFDTFAIYKSPSGVYDGNHRLRSLQYLGIKYFPAYLSGEVDELEKLKAPKNSIRINIV